MGAQLSLEHDPDQLEAVKKAEKAYLQYCETEPREVWLELPAEKPELRGLKKLRVLQIGPDDNNNAAPLAIFLHGGGGIASDWAPIMKYLGNTDKRRYWFVERPGHGISDPFDYLSIKEKLDEHAAVYIDAVREIAGVDKIDLVSNSAGGGMAYHYAKYHKDRIRTFTWIGAPAIFQGQYIPLEYHVLGSWIGTQMMARPPPATMPAKIHLETHKQKPEGIPDCYIELYRSFMSLRNNSLSFNYLLRAIMSNPSLKLDLTSLKEVFASDVDCHFILGSSDIFISQDQIKIIEEQFGTTAVTLGQGHVPWHDDPEAYAKTIDKILTL